jgi:hypothetical protein
MAKPIQKSLPLVIFVRVSFGAGTLRQRRVNVHMKIVKRLARAMSRVSRVSGWSTQPFMRVKLKGKAIAEPLKRNKSSRGGQTVTKNRRLAETITWRTTRRKVGRVANTISRMRNRSHLNARCTTAFWAVREPQSHEEAHHRDLGVEEPLRIICMIGIR